MNNYPPGVTGNEYEIAGPDHEEEIDGLCGNGHATLIRVDYNRTSWVVCNSCSWTSDVDYSDDDAAYDAKLEREQRDRENSCGV